MQYGIKSRPYVVFLHFGVERGKSALMSSEKWKPCEVVTCNAVDEWTFQFLKHVI